MAIHSFLLSNAEKSAGTAHCSAKPTILCAGDGLRCAPSAKHSAKFIEAPRPEFYDLQADPKELKNLYSPQSAATFRATQADLQAEMAKWKAKLPPAAAGAQPAANLPDPKDKIEVQNLLHNSMLASDDGRTAESRQYLEKAVQLDPDSSTALRQLGELELAAQEYPKAAPT